MWWGERRETGRENTEVDNWRGEFIICDTSELKASLHRLRREDQNNQDLKEPLHLHHQHLKTPAVLKTSPSRLEYALSPLPLIQGVSMISQYPLATLLPWPTSPSYHCPDLDCSLLLEGEGGVALQRYQPRSPESSPRHWVSTWQNNYVCPPPAVC